MDCSKPGSPVLHYRPRFAQTHVYWVIDATQPYHPLPLPAPPAFNLSQHQGLFQWSGCSHQMTKILELQVQFQMGSWGQESWRDQVPSCKKQKHRVWNWKSDAASVFPPHPLQNSQAEWPRQMWFGSKGQIIVGAVCLHNVERCLRPEAGRRPLASLSELEPRGEHFESSRSGTQRAPGKTGQLFQGAARAAVPHHLPSRYCKHQSTVCF